MNLDREQRDLWLAAARLARQLDWREGKNYYAAARKVRVELDAVAELLRTHIALHGKLRHRSSDSESPEIYLPADFPAGKE